MNQNRNLSTQTPLQQGASSFLSTAVSEFSNVLTGVWDTITGRTFKKTKALRVEQLLHQEGIKRLAEEVNDINDQISKMKSDMRKMKNLFDSSNQFMEAASVQINKIHKIESILEISSNVENINNIIDSNKLARTHIKDFEKMIELENIKVNKRLLGIESFSNQTSIQIKGVRNDMDLKDKSYLKNHNLLKAELSAVNKQTDKMKLNFKGFTESIKNINDTVSDKHEQTIKNMNSISIEIENLNGANQDIIKQSSTNRIEINESLEKLKGQNRILIYFIALIIIIELLNRFNVLNKLL